MSLPLPPSRPERLAFLGSPEVAVPALRALVEAGHEVVLVVSGPDRRRGRGGATSPTPVKAAAIELGLPVSTEVADVLEADVDLGVVVAFGKIISTHVLERVPMVNIHFSALPRWRGAAPIERAILAGDTETAVSIMSVAPALDEGDVWSQEFVAIGDDTTADELRADLAGRGAELLVGTIEAGFPSSVEQEGDVTYAAKIGPDDLELRWSESAEQLGRVVRIGGAWTTFRGERLKVWEADVVATELPRGEWHDGAIGTAEGALVPIVVQPAGKARMAVADWISGAQPVEAERFGDPS